MSQTVISSQDPRDIRGEAFRNARTLDEQLSIINEVSYLRDGEATILYGLASEAVKAFTTAGMTPAPFVEVGSRFGCSTMVLALAARQHGWLTVLGIDPHQWRPQPLMGSDSMMKLYQNLTETGLLDRVTPILGLSHEILPLLPEMSLLFIDGDHTCEGVLSDLRSIRPEVWNSPAIVCGHDYDASSKGEITDALMIFLADHPWRVQVRESIWWMER